MNPGPWAAHSRNVALAARRIAARVEGLDPQAAEILGLLHDIGRRYGVTGMRHILDGYLFLAREGFPEAGRVCLTHSFPVPYRPEEGSLVYVSDEWDGTPEELDTLKRLLSKIDTEAPDYEYDRLITLCDSISQAEGFCIMEQRLVDVAVRYGSNEKTALRWRGFLQIKQEFEAKMGRSIYEVVSPPEPLLLNQALLIIVTGLPCSGKTFLAERIAEYLSNKGKALPVLAKDDIKERLFDSLGWSDRAWSKKLGAATYELLFYTTEQLLSARQSLVVESNFYPDFHAPRLRALREKYPFRVAQIICYASGEVLVERFRRRWERGERHPGHVDPETYDELDATLRQGRLPPLDLGEPSRILEVDTTDFEAIDYEKIFKFVMDSLGDS